MTSEFRSQVVSVLYTLFTTLWRWRMTRQILTSEVEQKRLKQSLIEANIDMSLRTVTVTFAKQMCKFFQCLHRTMIYSLGFSHIFVYSVCTGYDWCFHQLGKNISMLLTTFIANPVLICIVSLSRHGKAPKMCKMVMDTSKMYM